MKIICKDNYDRETRSETVVAENMGSYYAPLIARLLNEWSGEKSEDFYQVVPDDYKPYIYQP